MVKFGINGTYTSNAGGRRVCWWSESTRHISREPRKLVHLRVQMSKVGFYLVE